MSEPATDKQIRAIYALEKELGRTPKWRDDATKEFARRLIEDLKEQVRVRDADRG